MQQEDSLRLELQQLVALQQQQLQETRAMRAETTNQARSFNTSPYTMHSSPYPAGGMFSPTTQQMAQTASGYYQAGAFIKPPSMAPHRIGQETADMINMQRSGNLVSGGLALGGAVTGGLADMAAVAMMGLPGIAVGAAVGYGTKAFTNEMIHQSRQQQDLSQYLFQTSNRYISRAESNNARYGVGFSTSERGDVANYLRKINASKFLQDDDITNMLKDFTDYGMLKTVTDVDSFKDKFGKLVDTVKKSAIMLNESYDNITKMMSDLRQIGIRDPEQMELMLGNFKVTGSNTGLSAQEVFNTVAGMTGNVVAGTSVSGAFKAQDISVLMSSVGKVQEWAEKNQYTDGRAQDALNLITNLGGTQEVTAALDSYKAAALNSEFASIAIPYAFSYDKSRERLIFNEDKFNELISMSPEEMVNAGRSAFADKNLALAWQDGSLRAEAIAQITNNQFYGKFDKTFLDAIRVSGQVDSDLTDAQLREMIQYRGGTLNPLIQLTSDFLSGQGDALEAEQAAFARLEQQRAAARAAAVSPWQRAKSAWDATMDFISDPAAALTRWGENAFETVSEWYIGGPNMNYQFEKSFDYSKQATDTERKRAKESSLDVVNAISTLEALGLGMSSVKTTHDGKLSEGQKMSMLTKYSYTNDIDQLMGDISDGETSTKVGGGMILLRAQDVYGNIGSSVSYKDLAADLKYKVTAAEEFVRSNPSEGAKESLEALKATQEYVDDVYLSSTQFFESGRRVAATFGGQSRRFRKEWQKQFNNLDNMTIDEMTTSKEALYEELVQMATKAARREDKDRVSELDRMLGFDQRLLKLKGPDKKWDESDIKNVVRVLIEETQSLNKDATDPSKSLGGASPYGLDSGDTASQHVTEFKKVLDGLQTEIDSMRRFTYGINTSRPFGFNAG